MCYKLWATGCKEFVKYALLTGNTFLMVVGIGYLILKSKDLKIDQIVMHNDELTTNMVLMIILCVFGFFALFATARFKVLWMLNIVNGILFLAYYSYILYKLIDYYHPELSGMYDARVKLDGVDIDKATQKDFDKAQSGDSEMKKCIDDVQKKFDCCAVHGPKDYNGTVPDTCYPEQNRRNSVYIVGCAKRLHHFWSQLKLYGTWVILTSGLGFACTLLYILLVYYVVKERIEHSLDQAEILA